MNRLRLTLAAGFFTAAMTYMGKDDYTFNYWVSMLLGISVVEILYGIIKEIRERI
jgi:hypothetical protein